ncbi:PAS domain-containing protein [Rhodovibrio salinarum]|uniref:PAS domain-containing protein n=1 Tax=Rhodovibrio salinarum TaxID=1087 RepID=UPI0004846403|nr:PAS domain-containing protein [Rhodovibrio salinarum]
MKDRGDFASWCQAAVERVAIAEARTVPYFQVAATSYTVWWDHCAGRIPCRQQLDPVRFGAAVLPNLTLIEVVEDGDDYRWRLCGEHAAQVMGTGLAGRCLSEVEVEAGSGVLFRQALNDVVREQSPLFYVLRHRTVTGCRKRSYGVLLPLRDADDRPQTTAPVRYILGASDWTQGA